MQLAGSAPRLYLDKWGTIEGGSLINLKLVVVST